MSTNVLMPQMGESVAEGTIVRWIKKVGDTVDKDEPLFEISTDKVDAEIPAPAAGTLVAIRVNEGDTVPVNSVVAVIGAAGSVDDAAGDAGPAVPAGSSAAPKLHPSSSPVPGTEEDRRAAFEAPEAARRPGAHTGPVPFTSSASPLKGEAGVVERRRTRSSPVVRRMAEEHGLDLTRLTGSGISGRVTRRDLEDLVDARQERREARRGPAAPSAPVYAPGDHVRIEKMSIMRRKIAEHMVASVRTSPHVYATYDVDFARAAALREAHKARYDASGARLTFTVFIARATAEALRECPFANASLDGENIVYKEDINLGIAVALEQGLIVPVVRKADKLSLTDLARAIQDVSERARTKQLKVDDVQGGTFTITNPGIFGATLGFPIINQPQVAILAVGSIDKRAVVVDDQVVVRPMCYLTLGHDHRLIDGAEGARFLRTVKDKLERFDEALL